MNRSEIQNTKKENDDIVDNLRVPNEPFFSARNTPGPISSANVSY